jgi:hypothetical protein
MQGTHKTSLTALSVLLLAACGSGGSGGGTSDATAPSAVTIAPASRMLTVSWDAVAGATGYNVYVAETSDVGPDTYGDLPGGRHAPSVPTRSVRFEGLEEGATYWAVVAAVVAGAEGPTSAPVSAVLPVGRVRDVKTFADAGSLRVVWASTRGASAYQVLVGDSPDVSEGAHEASRDESGNSAMIEGLENGRTYWFVVRAWNVNGWGVAAPAVSGTPSGLGTIDGVTTFRTDAGPTDLVLADLDLDGAEEILVANEDAGNVQVYAPGAGPRDPFALVGQLSVLDDVPSGIGVLDANADGWLDLAVARRDAGTVTIHLGNGDGSFEATPFWTIPVGIEPVDLVVADLDGNGFADILTADRGGPGLSLARGQPSVPYDEPVYEMQEIWGLVPVYDEWGTYLGDEWQFMGTEEVLVGYTTVTPDPFRATETLCGAIGPTALSAVDIDGDADLDVLLVDAATLRLIVLRNDGPDSIVVADQVTLPCRPDTISVASLTGSGIADAVLTSRDFSCLLLLANDGTGTYRVASELYPTATPADSLPTDMDGDGRMDIVVADGEGEVTVLLGNGYRVYHDHFRISPAASVAGMRATDVDGDGFTDLVVTDPVEGCVMILFGSPI